jgi:hypothetical protein
MTSTTDTADPTTRPDASELPAWLNVDELPESHPNRIEQRRELGARGVALATLLAQWVREAHPHLIDVDLGFDDDKRGGLRDRIEKYLGFAGFDYVSVLATEIDDMLEGRADDIEQMIRWVERRPEIFGPDSATAAISALVPELCAWVVSFVTNPPNRAHPDEHTPADLLAMALIGVGDALGHNSLSSLPSWERVQPDPVERDDSDERADERARQMMDAAQRLVDQFGGTVIWRAEGASEREDTILAPVDPNWSRDLDAAARLVTSYGFAVIPASEAPPRKQGWIPTAADVARFHRVGH